METIFKFLPEPSSSTGLLGFLLALLCFLILRYTRLRSARSRRINHLMIALLLVFSIPVTANLFWQQPPPPPEPSAPLGQSKTNTTTGPQSPIIMENRGTVTFSGELRSDEIPLRVVYYRISDLAASFFARGLLSPYLTTSIGDNYSVVDNEVYRHLQDFETGFGEPLFGDTLFSKPTNIGASLTLRTYINTARPQDPQFQWNDLNRSDTVWKAYLGGTSYYNLLVPDLEAYDVLFHTSRYPPGYHGYYPVWTPRSTGRPEVTINPILWRFFDDADLDNYENNYNRLIGKLDRDQLPAFKWTGRLGAYSPSDDAPLNIEAVEILRFIRGGDDLPEDFLLVYGIEQAHGGWSIGAPMRGIEVTFAAIQNVGDRTIDFDGIEYKILNEHGLRTRPETEKRMKDVSPQRWRHSVGSLRPLEAVIVPMHISFVLEPEDTIFGRIQRDIDRTSADGNRMSSADINETIGRLASDRNATITLDYASRLGGRRPAAIIKRVDALPEHKVPEFEERYDYGPAWDVVGVVRNDGIEDVRRQEDAVFTMHVGFEKGSCPYLFVFDRELGLWAMQGPVLKGAIGPDQKRAETWDLPEPTTQVRLVEAEDEISFIDALTLELKWEDGRVEEIPSNLESLKSEDGKYFVLRRGDVLENVFAHVNIDPDVQSASLSIVGFYMPIAISSLTAGN